MTRSSPWIRSHAPKKLVDVVGQERAVSRIEAFVKGFKRGHKPLLLYGPPGTGKTTSVYAAAEDLDLEVIELNASDSRNKDAITSLLGAALHQQSLFFKGKLILVDEADGISGQSDRGGVPALIDLVRDSRYPVIITANDIDLDKLKNLKKACELVEFEPVAAAAIAKHLGKVAKHESVTVDDATLTAIAHRAGGDARAAVNDLQSLSGNGAITKQDVESLGDRERKEALQNALLRVFKTTSASVALPAFEHLDEDVDQLFLWIDENLPKEYTKAEDLARAYDALAEADKFFGRIRRWQHYRFYVYIYNLLTAGIAIAKTEKYPGVTKYQRSSRLLTIWIMNQKNAKRKSVAKKLAAATHTSVKRAEHEVVILRGLFQNKRAAQPFIDELGLDADEVAWLAK